MYYDLRTNLPKEIMAFPGYNFPKPEKDVCFITCHDVQDYLVAFAKDYDLIKLVEFNTIVKSVKRNPKYTNKEQAGDAKEWLVDGNGRKKIKTDYQETKKIENDFQN